MAQFWADNLTIGSNILVIKVTEGSVYIYSIFFHISVIYMKTLKDNERGRFIVDVMTIKSILQIRTESCPAS